MTRHKLTLVGLAATCNQCDFQGAVIFPPFGFVGVNDDDEALWRAETDHNLDRIMDRLVEYPGKIPTQDVHLGEDPLHNPLPLETKQ